MIFLTGSRPLTEIVTGERPPTTMTINPLAVAQGTSSFFPDWAGPSSSFPDPAADYALCTSIFYTYVKINGQVHKFIVDSVNAVLDAMIHLLGLATHSHVSPYDVSWINTMSLLVRLQCRVPLRVNTYDD